MRGDYVVVKVLNDKRFENFVTVPKEYVEYDEEEKPLVWYMKPDCIEDNKKSLLYHLIEKTEPPPTDWSQFSCKIHLYFGSYKNAAAYCLKYKPVQKPEESLTEESLEEDIEEDEVIESSIQNIRKDVEKSVKALLKEKKKIDGIIQEGQRDHEGRDRVRGGGRDQPYGESPRPGPPQQQQQLPPMGSSHQQQLSPAWGKEEESLRQQQPQRAWGKSASQPAQLAPSGGAEFSPFSCHRKDRGRRMTKGDIENFLKYMIDIIDKNFDKIEEKIELCKQKIIVVKSLNPEKFMSFTQFSNAHRKFDFPLANENDFQSFNAELKTDRNNLQTNLKKHFRIAINVTRSVVDNFSVIIRKFINPRVLKGYTAQKKSENKPLFKSTNFYKCLHDSYILASNRMGKDLSDEKVLSALSKTFQLAKDWENPRKRTRKEREVENLE